MDEDRSVNSIVEELPHTYKMIHRLSEVIRKAIYVRCKEWLGSLTGEAEPEESPSDGNEELATGGREARERGLSERGRGSWGGDRPSAVLWVERKGEGGGACAIELRRGVDQRNLFESAWRHVEPESRIDTDDFSGYGLLGEVYDYRSVDHEKTYVTDGGVHCNTAAAEWSVFKLWWNGFRGVAKCNVCHYLSEYSLRRSHRSESRQSRLERIMALVYARGLATSTRLGACSQARVR